MTKYHVEQTSISSAVRRFFAATLTGRPEAQLPPTHHNRVVATEQKSWNIKLAKRHPGRRIGMPS